MIKVIHYQNEASDKTFENDISRYYDEVRSMFLILPETINIYFSNRNILAETGVGGHAHNFEIITISIDPAFKNKQKQANDVRATIFHEAFHIYQNFTYEGPLYSAIESAIYEGTATVFERQYAGVMQPYGDWHTTKMAKLKQWTKLLSNISVEDYEKDWQQWKFFHEDFQEQWISYKVGAYIVDEVLRRYALDIIELRNKTAKEVL